MGQAIAGRTVDFPTARAFAPFLQPARYKGAHGGRGSAKSHDFAKNLIKRCVERPGTRWACIREVQKSLEQSVKRLLEDKIKAFGLGDHFQIANTQIKTPGDGVIIFMGMQDHTSDSIKSLEGFHGAWVEEAQSLSARSLTLLRPTIRLERCRWCNADGPIEMLANVPCKEGREHLLDPSEIWFTWNPELPTDPVDQLLRGSDPPPDAVVVGVTWRDNPWFPGVLRAEMQYDLRRDPEKYQHVWGGGYQQHSEARVFKNWRVDTFEPPEGTIFYWGADWGFSVDPSTLGRCYLQGRTLFIDREAYKVGVEIDYMPAFFDSMACGCTSDISLPDEERKRLCPRPEHHGEARRWTVTADSARPETISYMNRHGYPKIVPAKKGAGSVEEGVIFLQGFDIVVHERCTHTRDELTNYRYKVNKMIEPGQPGHVLPILEDKKNHVIDQLRYSVEELIAMNGTGALGYPVEVEEASMWSTFGGNGSAGKPGTADWSGLGG